MLLKFNMTIDNLIDIIDCSIPEEIIDTFNKYQTNRITDSVEFETLVKLKYL